MSQPKILNLLEMGLRASMLRQSVIANNLANLETPNFHRSEVKFENMLAKAIRSGDTDLNKIQPEIVQPDDTPVAPNGNDVDMDMEIGDLIENSSRYKLYVRLMEKTYRQMESAIKDQ